MAALTNDFMRLQGGEYFMLYDTGNEDTIGIMGEFIRGPWKKSAFTFEIVPNALVPESVKRYFQKKLQ